MAGGVCERFRDDEVGRGLDLDRRRLQEPYGEVDGHRDARGERGEGRVESAIGEDRRVNPTGKVANLRESDLGLFVGGADELGGLSRVGACLEALPRAAQIDRQSDQSCLRSVVEVTLDPPTMRRVGCDGRRASGLGAGSRTRLFRPASARGVLAGT